MAVGMEEGGMMTSAEVAVEILRPTAVGPKAGDSSFCSVPQCNLRSRVVISQVWRRTSAKLKSQCKCHVFTDSILLLTPSPRRPHCTLFCRSPDRATESSNPKPTPPSRTQVCFPVPYVRHKLNETWPTIFNVSTDGYFNNHTSNLSLQNLGYEGFPNETTAEIPILLDSQY